jgi:hypothetical protein
MGLAIGILSGFGQTAMVGTAFALPLVVVVADDGTFLPVPGETVTFTVTLGSASVLPLTAVTNALGEASTTITAGLTIGPVTVQAAVTGASVDCALTVTPTITQAPVLIDSTYFSMNYQGFGIPLFFSPTLTLGTPSSAFPGPYEYGGKLYYVGYASLEMPHPQPDAPITAYSNIGYGPFIALVSSDGGATWALRDIANRPTFYISYSAPNPLVDVTTPPLPVLWRFIGGKVYWSMLAFGQFIVPYTSGQAWNAFGSFDLTSELFSPSTLTDTGWKSYGQGALAPAQVSLWPYTATDQIGGDLDTHESTIPPPPFVLNPDYGKGRLLTQIPGVGETDITPAYFAAWAHTKFEVAVSAVDSANKLHIIFRTITIPAATQYFYMRLDYGQPIEITAILPTDFPSGVDCNFGNPCFMGADWIVPVRDGDGHLGVVRIANYSQNAPIITYEPITPDPLNPAATNTSSCAAGGDVFVFFVAGVDLTLPLLVYFSVNDGTGWSTPELVCDNSILPTLPGDVGIKHFGTLSAALLANGDFGFITSTSFNVPAYSGTASVYFAAKIGFNPPPPPPPVIRRRPRIFGTRRIVILEPNSFDDCLKGLPELYRHIPWDQGICCVPDRYDYGQWKKFRPDAEPFRSIKAIPTPLAAAGDVLVTTFWPPLGWDGILHGIFNRYTGPGFREGGGDIEWRLQFGPAYAKQMGNILVQFGQVNEFYKLSQGIPFRSHRPIRFWVYAPNTSGGILPVNSQIVCGLEGWIFPRK